MNTYIYTEDDTVRETILTVSYQGLVNILSEYDHVSLFGDETLEELQGISECNVMNGDIDEISFIIESNSE